MNGLNSIGGATNATNTTGAQGTENSDFDAIFQEGIANTAAVMMQLIGGDIIQSVMKDESAVD